MKSLLSCALLSACIACAAAVADPREVPATREFALAQPFPADAVLGGIFVHDLDKDGHMDFVVSSEGHVGAYRHDGESLWVWKGNIRLFEYSHHPSVIAGNLDGGNDEEVAFLLEDFTLQVLNAANGEAKYQLNNLGRPVAIGVANLRGLGDQDIVLQYDLTHLRAIQGEDGKTLWETHDYKSIEHSPFRQADLDGDGLDEIAGAALIDHGGKLMHEWVLDGRHESMDSIVIADIEPGGPLEVALAEQRGANSHTDVVNCERILWRTLNPWNWEDPDKLVAGDFDPERPGLEVFNRSSGGDGVAPRGEEEPFVEEEAPWVLDAHGELIMKYYVNDKKPEWWTGHGLEEIFRIDWDGDAKDELAGKERHKVGAGAIVDAITGEFLFVFRVNAVRFYVADIEEDSREEVIVLDESGLIKVFANAAPNPHAPKPSPWKRSEYRRQKQNWNYYSP
ncbi:MAG: hypothetical protein IT365_08075 [Candidatus Hydrogenedentes bacterium]|nr:hypothetical protein [Candidatus Hydrogenedentota bacterium]